MEIQDLKGKSIEELMAMISLQNERIAELEKVKERRAKEVPSFLANFSASIKDSVELIKEDLLNALVNGVSTKGGRTIYPRWKSLSFGDLRFMVGFDIKTVEKAYKNRKVEPIEPIEPIVVPPPAVADNKKSKKVEF